MNNELHRVARNFLDCFIEADAGRMSELVAETIIANITNPEGGVDQINGAGEFLKRIALMDIKSANLVMDITQIVTVSLTQVLFMVEIAAQMNGRTLNNFASYLLNIEEGKITQLWMVEALPQYSDEFWLAENK